MPHRRTIYWVLIVLFTGQTLARLVTVRSSRGNSPVLSANDRSRWSTIRSLVDEGTYAIDNVIFQSSGVRDPRWYTIDMVRHRGPDGREHYYSSKPTLLVTLYALPYWLIKSTSGVTLAAKPFYVVRLTLLLVNVLPMIGFLVLLCRMVDECGGTSWSRVFVVAAAAFATPLTTFCVTMNNHSPAAMFVLAGTWAVMVAWRSVEPRWTQYAIAGICASMAAACELPALAFLALVAAVLLWKSPRQTLLGFVPPTALVLVAVVATNYLWHGTWSTPYAHRRDGGVMARIEGSFTPLLQPGRIEPEIREQLLSAGLTLSEDATLAVRPLQRGYVLWDPQGEHRYALLAEPNALEVLAWDNWYEYDGSYWSTEKQGVDRGERSQLVYAFHSLMGHHGVFSLTPIWLLSMVGIAIWSYRGTGALRGLALATGILTLVCLTFYIALRPLEDRNYGGVSCCFRWTLWLIPLWLLCLTPTLDAITRRPGCRWFALALLLISVFSATYNQSNPWTHPWLFDYWTQLGWIKY